MSLDSSEQIEGMSLDAVRHESSRLDYALNFSLSLAFATPVMATLFERFTDFRVSSFYEYEPVVILGGVVMGMCYHGIKSSAGDSA